MSVKLPSGEHLSPERRILRWTHGHALCMLLVVVAMVAGVPVIMLPVVAVLSLSVYLVRICKLPSGRRLFLGLANVITLARGALVVVVFLAFTQLPSWLTGLLLLLALILDGIDGFVARRWNEADICGQFLDVEVDALFVLSLCVLLWRYSDVPAPILFIGLLRYLYLLFLAYFVPREKLEPRRRYASIVAVFLLLALIARAVYAAPILDGLLLIACALVVWSFSRSLQYQIMDRS